MSGPPGAGAGHRPPPSSAVRAAAGSAGPRRDPARRRKALRHGRPLPVPGLAHRGAPGAPPFPDGAGRSGTSERRDLGAAIRYAVRYGARHLVPHGRSTGDAAARTARIHAIGHSHSLEGGTP